MSGNFTSALKDIIPVAIQSEVSYVRCSAVTEQRMYEIKLALNLAEHQGHSCVFQQRKFNKAILRFCLLAFMRHVFHVIPYIEIYKSEVR
jgi:hypothetical protein